MDPITPEQQLLNVVRTLWRTAWQPRRQGQIEELRTIADQLLEMAEKHAEGKLPPLSGEQPF